MPEDSPPMDYQPRQAARVLPPGALLPLGCKDTTIRLPGVEMKQMKHLPGVQMKKVVDVREWSRQALDELERLFPKVASRPTVLRTSMSAGTWRSPPGSAEQQQWRPFLQPAGFVGGLAARSPPGMAERQPRRGFSRQLTLTDQEEVLQAALPTPMRQVLTERPSTVDPAATEIPALPSHASRTTSRTVSRQPSILESRPPSRLAPLSEMPPLVSAAATTPAAAVRRVQVRAPGEGLPEVLPQVPSSAPSLQRGGPSTDSQLSGPKLRSPQRAEEPAGSPRSASKANEKGSTGRSSGSPRKGSKGSTSKAPVAAHSSEKPDPASSLRPRRGISPSLSRTFSVLLEDDVESHGPHPNSTWILLTEPAEAHRERVSQAFKGLALQGVLGRDSAPELLRRMGHREPSVDKAEAIVQGATLSFHLDIDDAVEFAMQYRDHCRASYEKKLGQPLEEADSSEPAMLDISVGTALLSELKTQVAPGVKTQLMHILGISSRALRSIGDRCLTQVATAEEIIRMRDMMIDHAGFTPSEHRRVCSTFLRYDRDNGGKLMTKDVRLALMWLGATPEFARSATDHLPEGNQGTICLDAFVEMVKAFFQHEESRIRSAMDQADEDRNGLLDREELCVFFAKLGFIVTDRQVLQEALLECNLHRTASLTYEDVYQVFMRFRECSGFTKAQLAEVVEAFDNFDKDNSLGLSAAELEIAMQWLGYPTKIEFVRKFLLEHDIDDSGEVELDEFAGFVTRYRDTHFSDVKTKFEKYAVEKKSTESHEEQVRVLPADSMFRFLLDIGYIVTKVAADELAKEAGPRLPFWTVVDVVAKLRCQVRDKMRKHHCFADVEVRRLRERFEKYAAGEAGLRGRKLAALVEELYPGIQKSKELHAKAQRVIEAADKNHDDIIDFDEYLGLMRFYKFEQRLAEIQKEKEAITKTTFSARERLEFRRVFDMFDEDASGDIDFEELCTMLDGVVPPGCLTGGLLDSLRDMDTQHGGRAMSFADFLLFMQDLTKVTNAKQDKQAGSGHLEREDEE